MASNAIKLHAVIDEAALRNAIRPANVMAGQLAHLRTATMTPVITIQVVSQTNSSSILSPPFTLLNLNGDSATASVACCHAPAGQILIGRNGEGVTAARATFDALTQAAITPDDTAALVAELANLWKAV